LFLVIAGFQKNHQQLLKSMTHKLSQMHYPAAVHKLFTIPFLDPG